MNFLYNLFTKKTTKLQQSQQKETINKDQYQLQIIIVKEAVKARIISPKKSKKNDNDENEYEQLE